MNKKFFAFLLICLFLLPNTLFAQENSQPLISLRVETSQIQPGGEIKYLIFYGNKGPDKITDAEIILDLFIDGDTNLEYVSSTKTIDWISSGDKRKPSWKIGSIDVSEDIMNLPFIVFKAKTKDTTPIDTRFSAKAYLYAPNHDAETQQTYSEEVVAVVTSAEQKDLEENTALTDTKASDTGTEVINNQTGEKSIQPILTESEGSANAAETEDAPKKLSNNFWMTLGVVFVMIVIGIVIGIIIGFILGVGKRKKYIPKENPE